MVGSVPLVDDALAAAPGDTLDDPLDDALDDPPEGVACAGVDEAVCANPGAANGTDKASASAVASGVLLNIEISSVEGPCQKTHAPTAAFWVIKESAAGWPILRLTGRKRWAGVIC
jgi:hypothetical protein